ncbi:MAG: selenocysteine-specific translation elongation factor [bacterium]|nr:MAG: selenocysteine-specific translation elongation factor [bacterium]
MRETGRHLIVGSAGHVDHGKTELIKALTGKDTDRLREEKERGISIVLGFAPLDLGDDLHAGVVDVPGHERFVKNMVSGAVGVDMALFVVAADEGVMPQTSEHLEVLRLLGVTSGVIAITKIDLVDEEIVAIVESEVLDLFQGTTLAGSRIVRTSAVTGEGIEDLREILRQQARTVTVKESDDLFRMPVDRIFSRSGIGTIVTGTTWSGAVRKGDEFLLEPVGKRVRVRELQSFDRTLEQASAGMRVALALHGIRFDEIAVGNQVLTPGLLQSSSILDASVEVSTLKGSKLKNRQRIRFHHAAGEIMARVILLGSEELAAGERGLIQLRLEKPTVARRGDRFVLRTYSPMRVVAGGTVLDPVARKARSVSPQRLTCLQSLDSGTHEEIVASLAGEAGTRGVMENGYVRYGMTQQQVNGAIETLRERGAVFTIGRSVFDAGVVEGKERQIVEIIQRYAERNRLLWGIEREELREKAGLEHGPLFEFILERGRKAGTLYIKGSMVRAGSADRTLSQEDLSVLEEIETRASNAGYTFVTRSDLARIVPEEKRLGLYLRILEERGSLVRVGPDGFLHAGSWSMLLEKLRKHLAGGGTLSVGAFKELCGFSRKYAVPLLEYLDNEGYTKREGDLRTRGPKLDEVPTEG